MGDDHILSPDKRGNNAGYVPQECLPFTMAMEGAPSLFFFIISGDALAADPVAAEVLEEFYRGFQVEMVRSLFQHAADLGFGAKTLDDIVIQEASV